MKKTVLTKILLLLAVVCLSRISKAQTDSLANLFYNSVQTTNNVLRFQNNALASVRFINDGLFENLQFYLKIGNNSVIYPKPTSNIWNEVLFDNLLLDVEYAIYASFQGQEYPVGSFNTYDNVLEPFEASNELFQALETWYNIPAVERPEAGAYLIQQVNIPFFERLAYIQVLHDAPFMPSSLLNASAEYNIYSVWLAEANEDNNSEGLKKKKTDIYNEFIGALPLPLDPNTLDKCICQYTLQTRKEDDYFTSFIDKDHFYGISTRKEHFNLGTWGAKSNAETYIKVDSAHTGPARSVDFRLQGWKTSGLNGKPVSGKSGMLGENATNSIGQHYAKIYMRLFCEGLPQNTLDKLLLIYSSNEDPPSFDFLTPTPAEACLCSKEVEICWKYDANLYAEAKEGECTRDNDHAAVSVQDYVEVSLQQGSSAKNVFAYGKTTLQAKCNTNYIDKRTKAAELAVINQELILINSKISAETDLEKLAELQVEYQKKIAEYIAKQGEIEQLVNECSSDNALNQLLADCRTITLKSNENNYLRMNSGYSIEAKGEDCFYALASIKSAYYLTAIMKSPNTTATDVKYCCAKKWGQYQLASFPGAPMSLTQAKTEVGSKFAFAGSWDFPYDYLASNPTMEHDRDVLTGGTRCDDVIFDNARVIQKDLTYFDEVQIQIVNQNALQIINLPISSDNFPVQTVITDMMGKIILNTTSHQKSFSLDNLPLRKGVYFVSLISGDNFKTFKILNYE